MSLKMGQATVISEVDRIRMVGSALRKTGRPVAFVPLTIGVHAGHIALVRAARRIRGAVTVVALQEPRAEDVDLLRAEGVDVIWDYTPDKLWPNGRRITISAHPAPPPPARPRGRGQRGGAARAKSPVRKLRQD